MPVFHLDIEAFPAVVEARCNPSLRQRPLVIAPPQDRALVLAASPMAKNLGITRGMPMDQVKRDYPSITIIPPNFKLYNKANRRVLQLVSNFSPIVEPMAYGHIAMDMTGMRQLYGTLDNAAHKLSKELSKSTGLQSTIGIASNKLVSTIAAKEIQKQQESLYEVPLDSEPRFLAPLTCKALPEWDNKQVRKTLFELNLRRISQIQALQRDLLSFALGQMGTSLHRHAMGVDPTPVVPPNQAACISAEHRFFPDTNDDRQLLAALYKLIEDVCFRMRASETTSSQLHLELLFTDDVKRRRRFRFPATHQENTIYTPIKVNFERLCDRRQRVRKMSIRMEGLHTNQHQAQLFNQPAAHKLGPSLDKLRKRFGKNAIHLGKSLPRTA